MEGGIADKTSMPPFKSECIESETKYCWENLGEDQDFCTRFCSHNNRPHKNKMSESIIWCYFGHF